MKTLFATAVLVVCSTLTGCATVFGDRYNFVELKTDPVAAEYTVRNGAGAVVASGVTPNTIKLKSSAGYFKRGQYSVAFSAPGHADQVVSLSAGMRGIYWGNLLVGGPIGMFIVDPASGAMWALPRTLTATLPRTSGTVISSAPPASMPSAPPTLPVQTTATREQQLQELQRQDVSYQEYQRRYREIMGQ